MCVGGGGGQAEPVRPCAAMQGQQRASQALFTGGHCCAPVRSALSRWWVCFVRWLSQVPHGSLGYGGQAGGMPLPIFDEAAAIGLLMSDRYNNNSLWRALAVNAMVTECGCSQGGTRLSH